MKYNARIVLSCVITILSCGQVYAGDALRFNPFEQPELQSGLSLTGSNGLRNEMKLRGTVIDGDDSLVNIGGEFYRGIAIRNLSPDI